MRVSDKTNYIFDLYGTLLDIRTDEHQPDLWEAMARYYSCFGTDYTGVELMSQYQRIAHEEEQKLTGKMGVDYPEIDLGRVFARLLLEGQRKHSTESPVAALSLEELCRNEWTADTADLFRVLSREKLVLYPGVTEILSRLKEEGKRIFLLSNAQRLFTIPEMEETGIADAFDAVYISSDYHMRKPEKEFIRLLIREQGISVDDSVMIGNDFQTDIGIAMSCGMESVYLNTYALSRREMAARQMHVMGEYAGGRAPEIVADGDLRKAILF